MSKYLPWLQRGERSEKSERVRSEKREDLCLMFIFKILSLKRGLVVPALFARDIFDKIGLAYQRKKSRSKVIFDVLADFCFRQICASKGVKNGEMVVCGSCYQLISSMFR